MRDDDGRHLGPLIAAGALLGVGLGGALEGIVLHQILRWHHVLSTWIEPIDLVTSEINLGWDGLGHAFGWIATVAGVTLLFRAARRSDVPWSGRALVGAAALGWGLFGFVEGVVAHLLLQMHHVRAGDDQRFWDVGYVVVALALIGAGWALIHAAERRVVGRLPPSRPAAAGLRS